MKRIMLLALALVLFCAWAGAEDLTEAELDAPVWMNPEYLLENYFHATDRCPLVSEDSVQRQRVFAEVQKKKPCPICWEDGEKYLGIDGMEGEPLECFVRGGTLVLRISDWAIAARMSGASEPAAVPENLLRENNKADDDIARLVHGEAYVAWAESAAPGTEQALTAYIPDLDAERTDALLMSRRHIGAAWVLVIRPNEKDRASLKKEAYYHLPMVLWRADLRVSTYDAGSLIAQGEGSARWAGDVALLPQASAGEIVYKDEENWTGFGTYVVADAGINTAVFRDANGDGKSGLGELEYLRQRTPLASYADGGDRVYICPLTDGEVKALGDKQGFDLWTFYEDDEAEQATVSPDHAPMTSIALPDGTVAAMDQAEYPVGTGFVSLTLTRPNGGIAYYNNQIDLAAVRDGQWTSIGGFLPAYADGDPERDHSGYFCDHVTLTVPLQKAGALAEGLYQLAISDMGWERGNESFALEFRVTADAPAPALPPKREFGGEGLIVMPHTPPHADAAAYNSCTDNTRVEEFGRTRVLAGDMVFELRGVDESWGWGFCSAYNLFAYPEGHPEQARQLLANFDHSEVTLYDAGDGLLLCEELGGVWRCDYDGGNLVELGNVGHVPNDLLPVGDGLYIVQSTEILYTALADFDPLVVYETVDGIENNRDGAGYAVWAEGQMFIVDSGIVALDALYPNPDGTLPANWLTNEYDDDSGANGYGYLVLNGRLYTWDGERGAMISMNLDGTDIREVSRERYWFHSATPDGCVLALSGTQEGMFGDDRTAGALFFPPDPANPTFDPDHSERHAIDPDAFDFVLGDYYYHRDAEENETRVLLSDLSAD